MDQLTATKRVMAVMAGAADAARDRQTARNVPGRGQLNATQAVEAAFNSAADAAIERQTRRNRS
jgi:hypothetical protein